MKPQRKTITTKSYSGQSEPDSNETRLGKRYRNFVASPWLQGIAALVICGFAVLMLVMHKPKEQSAASGTIDGAANDTVNEAVVGTGETDQAAAIARDPIARHPVDGHPAIGHVVQIDDDALNESSGLAVSGRVANRIWSHNDSGGRPRLYAYDTETGKRTGRCELSQLVAIDWEDMGARQLNVGNDATERTLLVVADCGDNQRSRGSIQLHVFNEPDPDRTCTLAPIDIRTLNVRLPGGPQDCEGVTFDRAGERILLVTKTQWQPANVYAVPLPQQSRQSTSKQSTITATRIAMVSIPLVTGIDVDAETGDFWMTSYWGAYRFPQESPTQTIAEQLATIPPVTSLPPWRQIEAIASAGIGRAWVSTEGAPAKLGLIGTAK